MYVQLVVFTKDVGFAQEGDRGVLKDSSETQYLVLHNTFGRKAWVDKESILLLNKIKIKQLTLWEE